MMRRDAMGLSAGKLKKSFQIRVAGGGCMEHGAWVLWYISRPLLEGCELLQVLMGSIRAVGR